MPRPSKQRKSEDINQWAARMVEQTTDVSRPKGLFRAVSRKARKNRPEPMKRLNGEGGLRYNGLGGKSQKVIGLRRKEAMALEKELETYKQKLPELKAEEGKFVLIQGSNVVRTFTSYEDAVKGGYAAFGPNTPFLVKRIQAIEQAHFISRFVEPCHTSPSQ